MFLTKNKKTKIYAITTELNKSCSYVSMVKSAAMGGASVIQFRDYSLSDSALLKTALKLCSVAKKHKIPFVMNNRLDIALAVLAHGIHVGQDDMPVCDVRRVIGEYKRKMFCGVSTHSLRQAMKASDDGADYIAIGPIWGTPTKPTYTPVGLRVLASVVKKATVPVVAIGGIDENNLGDVVSTGVDYVAFVRAVCGEKNILKNTRKIKSIIEDVRL